VLHTVAGWFGGSPMAMLLVAAAAVLLITAASGVFSYLGDVCMSGAGQRITSRIRADVFAYTQRLPMAFHDRQTVGELSSRVVSDTSKVESAACRGCGALRPPLGPWSTTRTSGLRSRTAINADEIIS
jgi:ATP-binding cassette subfamily B protein/subfamily B ATP-binding cassette protein MsbA